MASQRQSISNHIKSQHALFENSSLASSAPNDRLNTPLIIPAILLTDALESRIEALRSTRQNAKAADAARDLFNNSERKGVKLTFQFDGYI